MRAKNIPGKLASVFMALMLVLVATPASAGQIQEFESDFYISDMTGFEIEVSGPGYEIAEAELQQYSTGDGEIVHVGSENLAASLEISFYDDADTPQETIDIYLQSMEVAADSMEVIDRGIVEDRHYALATIQYEGVDILYLLHVEEDVQGNVDLLQAILTTAGSIESDLSDAQAEVRIDGIPFMDPVDPAELAEVVLDSGSLGGNELATPSETVETFTFAETNVTVGIGSDFSFVGESEKRTDVEAVRVHGPNTLSMIALGQTGSSPQVVLDSFSSGIMSNYVDTETLAEEIGDDHAWRLLLIPKGESDPTFMVIVEDSALVPGYEIMQAHELPADSVAGSLVVIQEQITLNGEPVLSGFDPEEIADIAIAEMDVEPTPASETPEATQVGTGDGVGDRSGDPREDARLPEIEDKSTNDGTEEDGNTSETGGNVDATVEPTEEPSSDSEAVPGELTDSSWEGEIHENLVEWDADSWFVDREFEGDIVSDAEQQEDTIVLQTQDTSDTSLLWISVYGTTGLTQQDYLEFWLTDEYLADLTEAGGVAEVIDYRTRSGNVAVMVQVTTAGGDEYLIVRQAAILEDGAVLIMSLDARAADMEDLYETAYEVTLNGNPALRVYSPSQIARILGN